jgi:hypothetical protein
MKYKINKRGILHRQGKEMFCPFSSDETRCSDFCPLFSAEYAIVENRRCVVIKLCQKTIYVDCTDFEDERPCI